MLKTAACLVSIGCVIALVACTQDVRDEAEPEASPEQASSRIDVSESEPSATEDHAGSAVLAGGQAGAVTNDDAIKGIVSARCAREAHCKNVGPDKEYADKGACEKKIGEELKEDLSPKDCPRGIAEKELNECLETIQKEECNNPIKKLARVLECRTAELCLPAK